MKKVKSRTVKSRLYIANRVARSLSIDDSNHSEDLRLKIT